MKIFVAGASGAIGKQLDPMLVDRGHEVIGMTRSPAKQDLVRRMGARAVVADALDREAFAQALGEAEPPATGGHRPSRPVGPRTKLARDALRRRALAERP